MGYKIGIISLGCPKNQVDAEMMLAKLDAAGFEIVDFFDGADAVIVNTCGFIDDAKKEAIENILEMADLKKDGVINSIIVTGCLVERYREEMLEEIPEIDAIVGIGANGDIAQIAKSVIEGSRENKIELPAKENMPLSGQRILTTPEYWAYLRIADGCSNCCSYCAIPSIRGAFRSREQEDILTEARSLAQAGVKELVVIAQDTTSYGVDLYGEQRLPALLEELCAIDEIKWIRLLYCYPDKITDELIDVMASQPKVLHYIDLPLQHADDKILAAMNRRGTADSYREVISRLRERIDDVVIRTTFIVGFPGEGEEEFENLAEFINEIEFDRLGCFAFSPQEGTPAFDLGDDISEETKARRGDVLMQDQASIVELKNNDKIGNSYEVLTEGYDDYTDTYFGRSYMDAPEIDGRIVFTSERKINDGEFVQVKILGVSDYDLLGREENSKK